MITLTITRIDGSVYWIEHFNNQSAAEAWLADEKTRPYWQPEWTTEITVDPVPESPIIEETQNPPPS